MRPLLVALFLWVPLPAAASDNSVITGFCLAAFKAAMAQAGKVPPPGMGEETCRCFLREVEQGQGIDVAQETCKAEAAARYNL